MSSPTGKKKVGNVFLNLVFTSRHLVQNATGQVEMFELYRSDSTVTGAGHVDEGHDSAVAQRQFRMFRHALDHAPDPFHCGNFNGALCGRDARLILGQLKIVRIAVLNFRLVPRLHGEPLGIRVRCARVA